MKPFRQILSLMALTLLVSPTASTAFAEGTGTSPLVWNESSIGVYSDIQGHWAYNDVRDLIMMGVVNGSDGKISPDDQITRAQFVKALLVATDIPVEQGLANPFADVPSDYWARDIIATAAKKGIVNGMDSTNFAPEENMTREQMAKVITTVSNSIEKATMSQPAFTDVDTHGWSYGYIVQAYQAGIIRGTNDQQTLFEPGKNASRAEAFVMIGRLLNKETKTTSLPSEDTLITKANAVLSVAFDANGKTVDNTYADLFTGPLHGWFSQAASNQTIPRPPFPLFGAGQISFVDTHVVKRMAHEALVDATVSFQGTGSDTSVSQTHRITFVKRGTDWKVSRVQPIN